MKDSAYLIIEKGGIQMLRKNRPDLHAGQVAVKIQVDVSDAYFDRHIPQAHLTLAEEDILTPTIDVAVESPMQPELEV